MADENRESPDASNDADAAPRRTTIVGVGASAGGVRALQNFFEELPPNPGAAFVVIVHLDPHTRSELPEILASRAKMSVKQVTKTSELKPNCIYVIPPDRQLRVSDDEIAAVPFEEPRGHRAPIDLFFRSLAQQHGDGFAVILTGAGSDGAIGVKAVKESGGIILVQDPEEAEYPSMPRSAIATGVADFILPVRDLAKRLVELLQSKPPARPLPKEAEAEQLLDRMLSLLRTRTGHDFTHYKRSTVWRRVSRRMQVAGKHRLEDYHEYLRETPEEAHALLADLLISVTTFFRDPPVFEALAKSVIPSLFENRDEADTIRVWVPGCATGEEPYSIAILLLEEMARRDLHPEIQIFATDMDLQALAAAREGLYPMAIEADLSEERLKRFFTRDHEHYRVKRELRDSVLFASHSLLKDPPFSRLDLISCRNLLIYLNRDLQEQVLATLHYSLNPNGFLLLGASETADHPAHLFRAYVREARLYQAIGRPADKPLAPPRLLGLDAAPVKPAGPRETPAGAFSARAAHREALEAAAPPSVLVDAAFRVLHLSESAGRFLVPSAGPLSSDLTELVREEMRFDLRSALNRAFERKETVLTPPLLVQFNSTPHRVYAQVRPIAGERERNPARALVTFVEGGAEDGIQPAAEPGDNRTVNRLHQELEMAHSSLRSTREESEAANEELRAANEELQSINEEYRSTAEELETSKEELQSINEELQTVNSELKTKLDAVSRANSDLQNLMAATDFSTLFLDSALRIKRFTPRIADLFNVTVDDIGRPITDFTHRLDYPDLAADVRKVLGDLVPMGTEVPGPDGSWYLVRLRPYRTAEDRIDGVVATFLDISERRRMEEALRASERNLRRQLRLVELSKAPIFIWDLDGGILQWNRGSEELYGYSREEALGKTKPELLHTIVPDSSFADLKQLLLEKGSWKGELQQTTKSGKHLIVESQIELIEIDGERFVLESTRDITESKSMEARLRLLLGELTHRVKNVLAVVQGMAHQTWRSSGDKTDFVERLDGRLAALAASHRLLVESDWKGADIRKLIENELAAYSGDPPRLLMKGESIALPSEIATPFGLVVHELATNAVKYGALSNENGSVTLSWTLENGNKGARLKFHWREKGGPGVKKPSTSGFGSKLIQQGLSGAEVRYEFRREGVECSIDIPLPEPLAARAGGTSHR
ncbi:MAG TPA: chemotaxis protein CheB [Rhizomicrobium sp.]|jgi:two-component system CheB/CheR fusion protein